MSIAKRNFLLLFLLLFLPLQGWTQGRAELLPFTHFPGVSTERVEYGEICFLLGKRVDRKGKWTAFGGMMKEFDRYSSQVAARELSEQTGTWNIRSLDLAQNYKMKIYAPNGYRLYVYPVPFVRSTQISVGALDYAEKHHKALLNEDFAWVPIKEMVRALKTEEASFVSISGKKIILDKQLFNLLQSEFVRLGEKDFRSSFEK